MLRRYGSSLLKAGAIRIAFGSSSNPLERLSRSTSNVFNFSMKFPSENALNFKASRLDFTK